MYNYNREALSHLFEEVLKQNLPAQVFEWIKEKEKVEEQGGAAAFNLAFASMPRKLGRTVITVDEKKEKEIEVIRTGFLIYGWTTDRLSRVWLLLQLNATDKNRYIKNIEILFLTAEMSELVALYSALPLLAYPQAWHMRCADGIRSNIHFVLEAIMCNNPYPSEQLPDAAWNQLVLKAFFTEKPVHQIIGLDKRRNKELALILLDYAHERWAAGRSVHTQLWRCIAPYIDESNFPDIQRIADSENTIEREAAALACAESSYLPAQQLLRQMPLLQSAIAAGDLTWEKVAQKGTMAF